MRLRPLTFIKKCDETVTYVITDECRLSRSVLDKIYDRFAEANYSKIQWLLLFAIYFEDLEWKDIERLFV